MKHGTIYSYGKGCRCDPCRAAKAAYAKAWADANHERIAAYNRAYNSSEKGLAQTKAWRDANPDIVKAAKAKWATANPERIAVKNKAWYEANRGRAAAAVRNWRKANPTYMPNRCSDRRARIAGTFVESVDRSVIYARDGGICQLCEEPIGGTAWHVDHIRPVSRGGETSYANTQLAHAHCNSVKSNKVA